MGKVGIIMGSTSDLPVMEEAMKVLTELGVEYKATVVSAHRTPDRLSELILSILSRILEADS